MLEPIQLQSNKNQSNVKGLTRALEESLKSGISHGNISLLLEHAKRNKVFLQALRMLDVKGQIRSMEEARYAEALDHIAATAENLIGLDYTFFKASRPVAYVPADVDVLVSNEEVEIAAKRLEKLGLRAVVKDSYCLTLHGAFIVDLYTYPNFANMIYLDAKELMNHVTESKVNGVAIRTLTTSAEAAVVLTHALYKEQLFTLNDKITIQTWLDKESQAIVEKLKAKQALELSQEICRLVDEGFIETPYKLPMSRALALMARKALQDPLTRVTMLRLLTRLADGRLPTQIADRMKRATY